MEMKANIEQEILAVRDYNRDLSNIDLRRSHHFTFAYMPTQFTRVVFHRPQYLCLGVNPGETSLEAANNNPNDLAFEETLLHDFRADLAALPQNSKTWRTHIKKHIGENTPWMASELFFWSSKNENDLNDRYGPLISSNSHFLFCVEMNKKIVQITKPKAVIFFGFGKKDILFEYFHLNMNNTLNFDKKISLYHCKDPFNNNWIILPHKSARVSGPGKINERISQAREYIRHLS